MKIKLRLNIELETVIDSEHPNVLYDDIKALRQEIKYRWSGDCDQYFFTRFLETDPNNPVINQLISFNPNINHYQISLDESYKRGDEHTFSTRPEVWNTFRFVNNK